MLSRLFRTTVGLVALVVPCTLAACSSAPGEGQSETESAVITHCGKGYMLECDEMETPHGLLRSCYCEQLGFYDIATYSGPTPDICGSTSVPIPSVLAGRGCTLGVMVDSSPIWACPVGTPVPAALGFNSEPTCVMQADGYASNYPCTIAEQFTSNPSNCIGTAPAGWMFVLDSFWIRKPINGACGGQCAMPLPPAVPPSSNSHN